jgi:hypothetical protein
MAEPRWHRTAARFVVLLFVTFLTTATFLNWKVFEAAPSRSLRATYSNGVVHLTIPYRMSSVGQGQLVTEVLDPEDKVLGRSERQLDLVQSKGSLGGRILRHGPGVSRFRTSVCFHTVLGVLYYPHQTLAPTE